MSNQIVTHSYEAELDEVILLLNPSVGFVSVSAKIVSFTNEIATCQLYDGRLGSLPITEFYPNKKFELGKSYNLLVTRESPSIMLSASHPNLVVSLLSGLCPEFRRGEVRVFAVARRIGIRTKIAVAATVPELDPVGVLVGRAANRIKELSKQLSGERVDVVPYNPELNIYVGNSLGIKVTKVEIEDSVAKVYVPSHQIQAALGGGGLNVALAANLTNTRMTIISDELL